ncbi:RES family NAD+ phosphorylase [Galbibacter marinus]|nr:RES family NAD+ phosphorylase [Galbibacter marinus]
MIAWLKHYIAFHGGIIYRMIVYRIYEDLPNRTAKSYGRAQGRWNDSIYPVIYTSSVPSLCMMELYSIHGPRIGTKNFVIAMLNIQIDEPNLPYIESNTLPTNWNAIPSQYTTQSIGNQWLNNLESLFLKVPSARLPMEVYNIEYNVLINPFHPNFHIKVKPIKEYRFKFNLNQFD